MEAYRVETVVRQSGTLILERLPFKVGEHVEVIVLPTPAPTQEVTATAYPLHGTVVRYDDPFAPVAESEADAKILNYAHVKVLI